MSKQSQAGNFQAKDDRGVDSGDRGDTVSRTGLPIERALGRSEHNQLPLHQEEKPAARASRRGSGRNTGLSQITEDRPIFTLSVAADLLGLHPRTLRIYEEKKLIAPARTGGNRRRYSQNDIRRFSNIRRLTLGGVNLEGVRIILEMSEELSRLGGDPNGIIDRNLAVSDDSRMASDE
jgi:MerR family transcriptional regulator/heat shock protein HspR